jgi:hypothetical protein
MIKATIITRGLEEALYLREWAASPWYMVDMRGAGDLAREKRFFDEFNFSQNVEPKLKKYMLREEDNDKWIAIAKSTFPAKYTYALYKEGWDGILVEGEHFKIDDNDIAIPLFEPSKK